MEEDMVKIDEQGLKIEIGENLLKAIRSIVNATESENRRNNIIRKLHPGKEIQAAFGINAAKIYKDYLNNKKHERSSSMP